MFEGWSHSSSGTRLVALEERPIRTRRKGAGESQRAGFESCRIVIRTEPELYFCYYE